MKTFRVYEEGMAFASVKAKNGVSALRKAARQFPRQAADYNDTTGRVVWRAESESHYALASVPFPSRGSDRVIITEQGEL